MNALSLRQYILYVYVYVYVYTKCYRVHARITNQHPLPPYWTVISRSAHEQERELPKAVADEYSFLDYFVNYRKMY